ncbi:MAG: hypothetical protein ACR2J4_00580 [Deinococcus sp.]
MHFGCDPAIHNYDGVDPEEVVPILVEYLLPLRHLLRVALAQSEAEQNTVKLEL